MRLLIDGYNLLHATDLFGTGPQAGTLEGSREALLGFLSAALSASERRSTTIVFDAAGAPPGLPRIVHHHHLTVRFAHRYADADALLEELIERHRAPRGLLVVSSDHRVQRAARQRGAQHTDSEPWYRTLVARRRSTTSGRQADKPTAGSVDYWVRQFSSPELEQFTQELRPPLGKTGTSPAEPGRGDDASPRGNDVENPFPPGYGDDLLEDEAL